MTDFAYSLTMENASYLQPAGLWQGTQSFEPGTLPLSAGRAAIALSWQTLQFK